MSEEVKVEPAESAPVEVDQEMYKRKYTLLAQKYKQVHLSNCKLRNRVYHVKKEIRYLKRLKRVLITQLSRHKDQFMTVCLEIPDSEPGSNVEDQIIAQVAESAMPGGSGLPPSLRRPLERLSPAPAPAPPPAPPGLLVPLPREELRALAQLSAQAYEDAKSSVGHIISAVISESRAERRAREEEASVPSTPLPQPSPCGSSNGPPEFAHMEPLLSGDELGLGLSSSAEGLGRSLSLLDPTTEDDEDTEMTDTTDHNDLD